MHNRQILQQRFNPIRASGYLALFAIAAAGLLSLRLVVHRWQALFLLAGFTFCFSRPHNIPPANTLPELTERESQILQLIGHGLSNRQISERLHLAEGTVKNYVSAIFQKLGVQDRTQAALMAQKYANTKG